MTRSFELFFAVLVSFFLAAYVEGEGSDAEALAEQAGASKDAESVFSIRLLKKKTELNDSDMTVQGDITSFTVEFYNRTERNIRAFDGKLTFTNLFNEHLLSVSCKITDPVPANSTREWSGKKTELKGTNWEEYESRRHIRFKKEKTKDIKAVFTVKRILFDNGEIVNYD